MPGLIKVGRTQKYPDERLRELYSTGVPELFWYVDAAFFADCITAEEAVLRAFGKAGERCYNKEFFRIEVQQAKDILAWHYRSQYEDGGGDYDSTEAEMAFKLALAENRSDWPQFLVDTLACLPYREREQKLIDFLALALDLGAEEQSIWLIKKKGVDPDFPLPLAAFEKGIDLYNLTAYETAIFLGYRRLEDYLERVGCNVFESSTLCWVIDCLVNVRRSVDWRSRIAAFGVELVKRGANLNQPLTVSLFVESPRRRRPEEYRFDLFPRNSGKTCREVIAMLADGDPCIAQLHKYIC